MSTVAATRATPSGLPPLLISAALAFWGWQTGSFAIAAVAALAIAVAGRLPWRFDLQPAGYERLSDLCTVFFVGFIVVSAAAEETRRVSYGILTGFKYLPIFIAPILVAQLVSSSGRLRLSALLRAVRKMKRDDPTTEDPSIDATGPYYAIVLLSTGIANDRGPTYFVGAALLVAAALFVARARHVTPLVWATLVTIGAAAGYGAQLGLTQLQALVEDWASEWTLRGMNPDPYRTRTDIGSIGRLKLHDAIVMRVNADPAAATRLKLLHRASFNAYSGTTWIARNAPLERIAPDEGGAAWRIAEGAGRPAAHIALRLEGGKALLALPAGATRVTELPAVSLEGNALGALRAEVGVDWALYRVEAASGIAAFGAPEAQDLEVPPAERAHFEALAQSLALAGLPPREVVARIERHFADYAYSTWRDTAVAPEQSPLAEFLTRSKSGHCEYFAAATTLLLRSAGIPARYATGFAMLEHSPLEDAYVVRARHAHAWVRAFVDGAWVDIDTTPPQWFAEEERLAPAWQTLADLFRFAAFRWSQRGPFEPGATTWGLLVVLLVILGWRSLRGQQRTRRAREAAARAAPTRPGADSGFYALEASIAARGAPRAPSEPLAAWVARVAPRLDAASRARLGEALALHQRYRFDPLGLDAGERARLQALCASLASAQHAV